MIVVVLLSLCVSAFAATWSPAFSSSRCPRAWLYRYHSRVNVKFAGLAQLGRPTREGGRRVGRAEADPLFWPERMTLGDKLSRLRLLAPEKVEAIGVLVDRALRESWPGRPDPLGRGRSRSFLSSRSHQRKVHDA